MGTSESPFQTLAEFEHTHAQLLGALHPEADQAPAAEVSVDRLFGELEAFLERGVKGGAYLLDASQRRACQGMLDYWSTLAYSSGHDVGHPILEPFDSSLLPTLPDDACPYVGLEAFTEEDADKFFGREPAVAALIKKVRDERLVVVTGPSGSGKSSLVLAGLLPALRAGAIPGSKSWNFLPPLVPGVDPLKRLAKSVMPSGAAKAAWCAEHAPQLLAPPYEHLATILGSVSAEPSLLVVDQFEEVFTLQTQESAPLYEAFVGNLLALANVATPPHRVLLTMREDADIKLPRYEALNDRYAAAAFKVGEMGANQLRAAIEKPVVKVGLKFQLGVVDDILHEVVGEASSLPLLQFALRELWGKRVGNVVKKDAVTGWSIKQALVDAAERVYRQLPPEQQIAADQVFLNLGRPGEAANVFRNRVMRRELWGVADRHNVDQVIKRFADARLIRVAQADKSRSGEDDLVEVTHESLLRNWYHLDRLFRRRREEHERRAFFKKLAEEWHIKKFDQGSLLGGLALKDAERAFGALGDLSALERQFLDASLEAEAARAREHKEVEERRLQAEREKAEAAARAAEFERARAEWATREAGYERFKRNLASAAVLACLIFVFLLILALQEASRKSEDAETAANTLADRVRELATVRDSLAARNRDLDSRRLANEAVKTIEQDPAVALARAREALDMAETPQAVGALYASLRASWQRALLPRGLIGEISALEVSPDGSTIFTAGGSAVREWTTIGTPQLKREFVGVKGAVTLLAVGPDGKSLAAGTKDGKLYLWRDSGVPAVTLDVNIGRVVGLAFGSHTGIVVAVAWPKDPDRDAAIGYLVGWFPDSPVIPHLTSPIALSGNVGQPKPTGLRYTQSGDRFLMPHDNGSFVEVIASPGNIRVVGQPFKPECPSARTYATGGGRYAIITNAATCFWTLRSEGGVPQRIRKGERTPDDLILSEDGDFMAELHASTKTIVVRGVEIGSSVTLPGAFDLDPSLFEWTFEHVIRFSRDAKVLAALRRDGSVSVFDLIGHRAPWLMLPLGRASISPSGKLIALIPSTKRNTIELRERATGRILQVLTLSLGRTIDLLNLSFRTAVFSSDERHILIADLFAKSIYVFETSPPFTQQRFSSRRYVVGKTGALLFVEGGAPTLGATPKASSTARVILPNGRSVRDLRPEETLLDLGPDGATFVVSRHTASTVEFEVFRVTDGKARSILVMSGKSLESEWTYDANGRFGLVHEKSAGTQSTQVWDLHAPAGQALATLQGRYRRFVSRADSPFAIAVADRAGPKRGTASEIVYYLINLGKGTQTVLQGIVALSATGKYVARREMPGSALEIVDPDRPADTVVVSGNPRLRFSPNDRYLAAVYGEQGTIALYDLRSRKLLVELPLGPGIDVEWAPEGEHMVVRSAYGVEVMPVDLEHVKRIAVSRLQKLVGGPATERHHGHLSATQTSSKLLTPRPLPPTGIGR